MERCKSHPPSMCCFNCGAGEEGSVLDEPKEIWARAALDEEWSRFTPDEAALYKELFATYKPIEKELGQAATLAAQDVLQYRRVLARLSEEQESIQYQPGLPFLDRVAQVQYAKDTGQLADYWKGWRP